jgi:aspartate aminotransferase
LVIIDSVSKRFNACGARIGTLLTQEQRPVSGYYQACQGRLSVSTVEQYGAVGLYEAGERYVIKARDEYQSGG